MPTKTFTAAATFTSTAGQFLISALNTTATKIETFNLDSAQATYVIPSASSQSLYIPQENNPLVYVFVQAATTNISGSAHELALVYSGSNGETTIAKLKPGDWAYLPYSGSLNTRLNVVNSSAVSSSTVSVLYAESGSGA